MKNKNTFINRSYYRPLGKQHDYRSRGNHEIDPLHHIGYLIYLFFLVFITKACKFMIWIEYFFYP